MDLDLAAPFPPEIPTPRETPLAARLDALAAEIDHLVTRAVACAPPLPADATEGERARRAADAQQLTERAQKLAQQLAALRDAALRLEMGGTA